MEENEETLTAKEELMMLVEEDFSGENELRFLITEEGHQRIEIEDLQKKEVWFELEVTEEVEDDNFEDLSELALEILDEIIAEEIQKDLDSKAQLN